MPITTDVVSWNLGRWFSPGPPISSTNKSDHRTITEILLKVELNTIIQKKQTIKINKILINLTNTNRQQCLHWNLTTELSPHQQHPDQPNHIFYFHTPVSEIKIQSTLHYLTIKLTITTLHLLFFFFIKKKKSFRLIQKFDLLFIQFLIVLKPKGIYYSILISPVLKFS